MSLIGSLEDLGLGDILQIISLSQKSGLLSIRGEGREGTIILQEGLVRGAFLKGGPTDLRSLLVDGGFVASDEFDRAREDAAQPQPPKKFFPTPFALRQKRGPDCTSIGRHHVVYKASPYRPRQSKHHRYRLPHSRTQPWFHHPESNPASHFP